jgi:ABC-type antimicrobial peptide transport system permease subunit
LEGGDLDALFGAGTTGEAPKGKAAPSAPSTTSAAEAAAPGSGVYNLVFVRLKPGVPYGKAVARLSAALTEAKTGVRVLTWNKASGPIGSMALIIRGALFIFVMLLFCVAVIIIINTLTMAALERTSELGMMRAVGAHKSFISGMFLAETSVLSIVFGGAGIAAGMIVVKVIPWLHITTNNDMVQILYGGDTFHPLLGASDVALAVLQLSLVTVVAALYPMKVARGITPLDAVTRD